MRTKMTWGDRYEGGWSYGGRGVHLSYFQIGKQDFKVFGTSRMNLLLIHQRQEFTFETPSPEVVVVAVTITTTIGGGGGGGAGCTNV